MVLNTHLVQLVILRGNVVGQLQALGVELAGMKHVVQIQAQSWDVDAP